MIIKMAFIKEESEDIRIEEAFGVKHEDAEEQTGLMALKEECQELDEMEETNQYEKHNDFMTGEKSTQTEKSSPQKGSQKTESNSYFTCRLELNSPGELISGARVGHPGVVNQRSPLPYDQLQLLLPPNAGVTYPNLSEGGTK
ncbi:unnamed protein product [Leuciscus chuanchicus]